MTLSKAKQDARQFRRYREALGLTQDELAGELGWGEGTLRSGALVWMKEKGKRPVRKSDLLAVERLVHRAGKWPVK